MYRAGKDTKELESKLYMQYDCGTGTMYVLILVHEAEYIIDSADDIFLKIDNRKKFGGADISKVMVGGKFVGLEAKFEYMIPEVPDYMEVHVNVYNDGGSQPSATSGTDR
jgi:hypothetical protein